MPETEDMRGMKDMEDGCCGMSERRKVRSPEEIRSLTNRLNRIEGQVRGIRAMLEKHAYCPDILTQTAAARSALDAFAREVLSGHIRTCVAEDIRQDREGAVEELLGMLQKLMR